MKIKIPIISVGVAILVLASISCKKFLEVKSDAKLVIPKTLGDLQAIMDDADKMNFQRSPSYGETSADDYFIPESGLNALNQFSRDLYFWTKVDYRYQNDWSEAYLPVYNANLCLETLSGVERNTVNAQAWDNIKGSALFFRSFYFFALTTQFGLGYDSQKSAQDLGIVLRLQSDFNVPSQRASVQACLERVISDAVEAAGALPNQQINTLRPCKAAAFALLSRVFLYMRDYEKASLYADQALKIQSALMNFNSDNDILGLDTNVPFKRFNKETIFYSEMTSSFGVHFPNTARIDTALYSSYDLNDLRRRAYFRVNGAYQQFKGTYASSAFTLFSGLATDEMYLNRAEGKAWAGDISGAMNDLNLLLKSRWKNTVSYVSITASGKEDALQKIRVERRKELLMRNIRWQDLKRLNKEGNNIVPLRNYQGKIYRLEANVPFYALPLPIDIVEQTGIAQN
ncbi:RagB/SusD family nutrient uptake outer membrane protein [Pedobacter sp. Leaf194]|uniref:RagB/SusD family nutrient uptake outer membrane protein n=1 Tax=Pedobacter sp. Leaf194 TaxID=1736297 RepID=UPI00070382AC|nr:RagB/SusD family nutrient uptake outer membrane protein [Pedobacter sp. Leaf194]KQS36852.1 hypothetical protein ASG14_07390 [Pedobacter sp. Leaf194]